MDITEQLLAAYAKDAVSEEQRAAVRCYLLEHPWRLSDVLALMDEPSERRQPAPKRSLSPDEFSKQLDTLLSEIDLLE